MIMDLEKLVGRGEILKERWRVGQREVRYAETYVYSILFVYYAVHLRIVGVS